MVRRSIGATVLVAILVGLVCSSVLARSIPNAPNEVEDPWFENPQEHWYISPALVPDGQGYPTVTMFTDGTLFGGYLDPGRSPGDKAFARTIVDDYDGLWNPDYSQKEIDLCFYAHIHAGGYVKVRFDWWDDPNMDRPPNNPDEGPAPDGYSPWYTITADDPGEFELRPDLILDGETPGWFATAPYCLHQIWDHQPRWVSIEFECGNVPEITVGGEAMITGVDFEAQCVPEPSVFVALGGMIAMGLASRRRRQR